MRSLFAMAVYGLGYLTIGIYYLVLLVVAIGSWLRRHAEQRRAASAALATPPRE